MKRLIKPILLFSLITSSISGCLNSPVKPIIPIKVSSEVTTYIVPSSQNLIKTNGHLEDIILTGFNHGHSTKQQKLKFEWTSKNWFIAHRRVDNGHAGSGIKYLVKYETKKNKNGYSVALSPIEYTTYQEGFIGKFDIPSFSKDQLQDSLQKGTLKFKFEFDSEFGTSSVNSNFERLSTPHRNRRSGKIDLFTKKVIPDFYSITNRESEINLSVTVVPYRDGSKVEVVAVIPATETSKNTIDFSIIEKEVQEKIRSIIEA